MKQGQQIFTVVTLFGGFILVYSGIKNVNPIELMKNTLQGKKTEPVKGEFEGAKSSQPGYTEGSNKGSDATPGPGGTGRNPYGTPTDIPRGRYGNGAV